MGGIAMTKILLTLAAGIGFGAIGMTAIHEDGEQVATISERKIVEKLDGKDTNATIVEVTLEPGQAGVPHRHPGPAFGYILEGEYEWGVDGEPAKVLKAGETFYEPTGCLHRVSRNPSVKGKTRVLALVLLPQDAEQIAIPERPK
jgi:quercetin dioxygenase-like cupin family protein